MMLPRCKLVRASHHYVGSITAVSGNEPALIPEEHGTERVAEFEPNHYGEVMTSNPVEVLKYSGFHTQLQKLHS